MLITIGAEENWPRFRGQNGQGISQSTLPKKLSPKNLAWSVDLKGTGSSSPVVWAKKLFITAKTKTGLQLIALHTETGKTLWKKELETGDYHTHKFNNSAASTPCITSQYIALPWFNTATQKATLTTFNHEGKVLWQKELGSVKSKHGYTANPATHKGIVIANLLHQGESHVFAYNIASGKELWKYTCPSGDVSYSTPLIRQDFKGEDEVIITGGTLGMLSLNLKTGKKNWLLPKAFTSRTVNSPIELQVDGKSFICASQKGKDFCAVQLPSAQSAAPEYFWQQRKIGAYVPSLISQNGLLYILQDDGTLASYNFSEKKLISKIRLGADVYSSPIFIGNSLYCLSRFGKLFIVNTQPKLDIIQTLDLNPPEDADWLDATPIAVNNCLYIRLASRLDCYK